MVDPKNLGIPVWVNAGANLRGPEHNERAGAGVDCIAVTADVICCIVDGKLAG